MVVPLRCEQCGAIWFAPMRDSVEQGEECLRCGGQLESLASETPSENEPSAADRR